MQWVLGSSSNLLETFGDAELRSWREAGLSQIELGLLGRGINPAEDIEELNVRVRAIQRSGLELWSVHLPYGKRWDIAGKDAEHRAWVISVQERLIQRAGEWGAQVAVVHPGAEPIMPHERPEHFKRGKDALHRLQETCRAHGVRLAAECLPRTCLGNTSNELLRLLDDLDEVGICFDTNHLLQERAEAFVRDVGDKIITTHVSDYDGIDEKHWMPGRGIIDWTAVFRALADARYGGPLIFEVSRKNADKRIEASDLVACARKLVKEAFER